MANTPSNLDLALRQRVIGDQARAELISCALFVGATFLIFLLQRLTGGLHEVQAFGVLRWTFIGFVLPLLILGFLAWKKWWHPALGYLNTGLQVTLLSAFLFLMTLDRGTEFAMSTAIPMLYCLAIAITAFRLNPALSFFAGALAAVELIILYAWVMRPQLIGDLNAIQAAEMMDSLPTLAWPAIIGRVIVLLTIGAACAFAARSLLRQTKKEASDQSRIQLLERTFGRLVAPDIARRILEDDDWMTPSRRDAVVMFADLKGFTAFSEGKSPEEVAKFLNRCWTVAATIVEQHGGVINKYMGDGFLAIFGVPLELENAERAAAETASQLQDELQSLLEPEGLSLCIGLHAGPMIVGGIGSEARCEFTVIGSTVNLASRLEGLNRSLDTLCLASEQVAGKIDQHWELKNRGGQKVKGVTEAVDVFELGGKKASGASGDAQS